MARYRFGSHKYHIAGDALNYYCKLDTPSKLMEYEGVDVFSGIADAECKSYLQNMFNYREIGSCCIEYWIELVTNHHNLIIGKYQPMFDKWNSIKSQLGDFTNAQWEMDTESDGTHQEESLPETVVDDNQYLDSRGKNTNSTVQTYKGSTGMNVENLKKMFSEMVDPYYLYAMEFNRFFVGVY